ncbi:lytic transglycosylase domain-containing protein [Maritimibacter sp. DP1N21-5]|uniref:lytic transglycosylase domain-containing protein n=1 Tax=Maritimibacter sp. DP1N21-5 TaxID=2836867 RepID=UPI001C45B724|nr:lytic transglycosylase domain-containing protein [Maritimibacter sp. DP1N21-5]MBV7410129.1 lytic transglycosylase domain-containing protein [Maritimibacter sp. DP1N21-5]
MTTLTRRAVLGRTALGLGLVALAGCGQLNITAGSKSPTNQVFNPPLYANESAEVRALIDKWADYYQVPRELVHRQVKRESSYNPGARNGPYYGLMQILPQTARTMGHQGPASELLNPDINLKYAVKYLRGAYLVAGGDQDAAMGWYARGYYYEAKRQGLLYETGLRT